MPYPPKQWINLLQVKTSIWTLAWLFKNSGFLISQVLESSKRGQTYIFWTRIIQGSLHLSGESPSSKIGCRAHIKRENDHRLSCNYFIVLQMFQPHFEFPFLKLILTKVSDTSLEICIHHLVAIYNQWHHHHVKREWLFFMADILTWHSRKSTGETTVNTLFYLICTPTQLEENV